MKRLSLKTYLYRASEIPTWTILFMGLFCQTYFTMDVFAETQRFSLLPLLDKLEVGTGDIQGIPIACSEDLALSIADPGWLTTRCMDF